MRRASLKKDVVALVDAHLLDLGGSYGEPGAAASPFRREELP